MKPIITLLLLALLALVPVGCKRTPHVRIGISQCSDDDWRRKMNAEIQRELMFHPEVTAEIRSAGDDNATQIADIRYFIDNKFDIIIAAPNEAEALTPIIAEAHEKGIPVLLFDRNVNGHSYTAWQGADNHAIGRAAGEYTLGLVGAGAPVMEIYGLKGSTPADDRHYGFNEVEGINVVARAGGNWNADRAAAVADSMLTLHPEVKAIYAHNDRMAIAAAQVAREHGITPYIIGIDAAPEIGIRAVADSVLTATFLYPTRGEQLVKTAMAILEEEPYDTTLALPAPDVVDIHNARILLQQNESLKEETTRMERLKTEVDEYWAQHSSQTTILYAVIAIALLLAAFIFMLLRAFWQHKRHQAALEAATASKLAFFTNVSHDIRTPLTLIAEPVEQLAEAQNITPKQRTLLQIADKNVRILKRMINQILDFRKYDNGKLELKLTEVDLGKTITDWSTAFTGLARKRDIDFIVNVSDSEGFTAALDTDKMERVFYNLVANAFKFTPDNGKITVTVSHTTTEIALTVSDTGKGISAADLPMIFDRFFQVEHSNSQGSGIGLALVKAFVELHGGTVSVSSQHGEGTTFTVKIPVTHVAEEADTAPQPTITADVVETELSEIEKPADTSRHDESDERPSILVIDDNADLRNMLTSLLSDDYDIHAASNGVEGLRIAAKYVPDLVVCDVMMPEMDGLECCRRIKAEISTSHIPVLMLTACAMDRQRAEGYEVGADGYLAKPFNATLLKARIRNLIENRKRIRNVLGSSVLSSPLSQDRPVNSAVTKEKPSKLSGAPDIDNEFYNKFIGIVENRLADPELNVEELAAEMGLGRSQFYRKIKSLTNYSPVELLRRLRLERARALLTTTERTISEISYGVGFSNPAYFTKCYREAYGETPSELREKLGQKQ